MLFAMLTNIIEEKTELLYVGKGARSSWFVRPSRPTAASIQSFCPASSAGRSRWWCRLSEPWSTTRKLSEICRGKAEKPKVLLPLFCVYFRFAAARRWFVSSSGVKRPRQMRVHACGETLLAVFLKDVGGHGDNPEWFSRPAGQDGG